MRFSLSALPKSFLALSAVVLVLIGFAVGMVAGKTQALRRVVPQGEGQVVNRDQPAGLSEDVDFDLFWEVWNLVKEKHFVQPLSDKDLFYGAIRGMVDAVGDPYTVYFDPVDAQAFEDSLDGAFDGIGAEIGIKDDQLQIVAPLPGTPAQRAGLQPGDDILLIDGKETTDMTIEEAVTLIRGEKGTSVELGIMRKGMEEPQKIPIKRETIIIESVRHAFDEKNNIGEISIFTFNKDTNRLFNDAVNDLLAKGVERVVLDLRSNPGGLLTSAIDVASAWVGYEPVMLEKTPTDQRVFSGVKAARFTGIPTVVLVNGGSASASEIVAGALQDHQLATLVGTTTFGKGSVQDYLELPDDSAVKVTVAHWFTPKGRGINEEGIVPDVKVEFSPEEYAKDQDPQKEKAIEILTAAQ